jgi:hypothetical protein
MLFHSSGNDVDRCERRDQEGLMAQTPLEEGISLRLRDYSSILKYLDCAATCLKRYVMPSERHAAMPKQVKSE